MFLGSEVVLGPLHSLSRDETPQTRLSEQFWVGSTTPTLHTEKLFSKTPQKRLFFRQNCPQIPPKQPVWEPSEPQKIRIFFLVTRSGGSGPIWRD